MAVRFLRDRACPADGASGVQPDALSLAGRVLAVLPVLACAPAAAPPVAPPKVAVLVTVPIGAWQRDWIRRHGGAVDASVAVRYVQTATSFGDLRIRADRPEVSPAMSLAELSDDQLAHLARQSGFAGFTTVEGDSATWHHEIDFQPASDEPDIGRIEPAGVGRMFEHALDGSYVESWSVLPRGTAGGGSFAARVERSGRVDQLLAVAGEHFVYARARAVPLPPGESLAELIERTRPSRETLLTYLDCELSFGTTWGWQIERSTLPWLQGQRLAVAARIGLDASGAPMARVPMPGEHWSFPVASLAPAELRALFPAP